ncbi:MaoC family dehydratase [Nesterenkonia alba]|uniref:MaoC family dehydratase n=1 Tax=Nesterenkonia alba TaxID=515814 RepID=UPI0003B3BD2F|nr:MaoC/PaaZ C-terminal domain-containing protein [Nesterenkonia alba]
MVTRIELPQLGRLYRHAALDDARRRITGRSAEGGLPEEPVLVRHPGISVDKADQYRALIGSEVIDGVHRRAVPSVLVHIAVFPVHVALMTQDSSPLPLMGMVHLANDVTCHRPVLPAEPFQILVWAENMRPHRRGTQLDVVAEVYPETADVEAAGAQTLYRGVSTYLSRGVYAAGHVEPDEARGAGGTSESPRGSEAPVGEKTGLWKLGADAGRKYAAVSGDYNPIHLSAVTARALGMPRPIVHGMYSAGRMLAGREPEQAGHRWTITFGAPVRLPGTVAFSAKQLAESHWRFTGWHPRKKLQHFRGELHLLTEHR